MIRPLADWRENRRDYLFPPQQPPRTISVYNFTRTCRECIYHTVHCSPCRDSHPTRCNRWCRCRICDTICTLTHRYPRSICISNVSSLRCKCRRAIRNSHPTRRRRRVGERIRDTVRPLPHRHHDISVTRHLRCSDTVCLCLPYADPAHFSNDVTCGQCTCSRKRNALFLLPVQRCCRRGL